MFKAINRDKKDGTVIVGEDDGHIAIDISIRGGDVISYKIRNIIVWFNKTYNPQ